MSDKPKSIEDRSHAGAGTAADEFAWRAFRYVHGELTADEAEAFEEDLAVEQAAREALAQAVELTAALETTALETIALETSGDAGMPAQYMATRQPAPAQGALGTLSQHRWSRRQMLTGAGIVGAGIAACLAVVVTLGLMGRLGPGDSGDGGPTDPGSAQAALAEAWAGIGGDEWHDAQWHDNAPLPMVFSADADVADEDRLRPDHEAELSVPSVPSWLLAALDPQRDETPEIEEIKEIKQ